jgi:GTP-binding protein
MVDLPGYGYAKVAKTKRAAFSKMTLQYLSTRENLMCLFVLIDIRIEPQALDLSFLNTIGEADVPFVMVFTKSDKLTPTILEKNIAHYKAVMLEEWDELPNIFVTSSEKGLGRDDMLNFINQLNSEWIQ